MRCLISHLFKGACFLKEKDSWSSFLDWTKHVGCHYSSILCCSMNCIISLTGSPPTLPLTPPSFLSLSNVGWSPCRGCLPHICLKPGCWCLGANYTRLNSPWRQRLTCHNRWAVVLQGKENMTSKEGSGIVPGVGGVMAVGVRGAKVEP